MACDPLCRAPRLTDMIMQPIPPILRSNTDEHKCRAKIEGDISTKMFQTAQCDIKQFRKNFAASHALFPYEEDAALQHDVGLRFLYILIAPQETNLFQWFINETNKDFSYEYHQTVLQMLHDVDPPRTHWQLKSPQHTLWIDSLLKYYPQASLIMCHRRLDEVLPSIYRYCLTFSSTFFNEQDSENSKIILDEIVPKFLDILIDRMIKFRSREPSPKNVFDIKYEDLMKDPINTVRRIYDRFDFLKWSDEFETAMHTWLIDNPQGKQGRHVYSLAEFGLETQMNKQLYKDYEKLYISS